MLKPGIWSTRTASCVGNRMNSQCSPQCNQQNKHSFVSVCCKTKIPTMVSLDQSNNMLIATVLLSEEKPSYVSVGRCRLMHIEQFNVSDEGFSWLEGN